MSAAVSAAVSATQLDHLVIFANTLEEGVAWCESTFGITPGPGGKHPLMGTHNRLFRLGSPQHPRAYFEIIAIELEAIHVENTQASDQNRLKTTSKSASDALAWHRTRWFDMDDPALRESVRRNGPQLAHWVASVADVRACVSNLQALGIDRGEPLKASRQTPFGLLEWQITVRPDGRRLFDGCLPTLIQWGQTHASDGMSDPIVSLVGFQLQHPEAKSLRAALDAIGLHHVAVLSGPARLSAQLQTPKGLLHLHS